MIILNLFYFFLILLFQMAMKSSLKKTSNLKLNQKVRFALDPNIDKSFRVSYAYAMYDKI